MKKKLSLNRAEMEDCCDIHKEMMESIAKISSKYNDEKNLEIFGVAIALTISNTMTTFGISTIDVFLNDLLIIIKSIHHKVKENSCYMEYQNGKKISEGRFN